jgi:alpha-beta hydrolase superfamily lysophospholipase
VDEGWLKGTGGVRLFFRHWVPERKPRGEMVLVHGAFEHSGQYQHVGEYFARAGFDVRAMDHRGFGRSEGHRCYIESFDEYLRDLDRFIRQSEEKPVVVGHSMGGLVAFHYAATNPETVRALVLSSPWFQQRVTQGPLLRALRAVAPLVAWLAPRLHIRVPVPEATSNPEVQAAQDPYVWNRPTPRWYVELERAAASSFGCSSLRVPALFLQAGDDHLVSPEATRRVYEQIEAPVRGWKLYPEKYHEIFNDKGYDAVFRDILTWLEAHGLIEKPDMPSDESQG